MVKGLQGEYVLHLIRKGLRGGLGFEQSSSSSSSIGFCDVTPLVHASTTKDVVEHESAQKHISSRHELVSGAGEQIKESVPVQYP